MSRIAVLVVVLAGCAPRPVASPPARLPAAVEQAIHGHAGDAPVAVELEADGTYDVEWVHDGRAYDASIAPDGRLLAMEVDDDDQDKNFDEWDGVVDERNLGVHTTGSGRAYLD